ncbi:alpha-1,4-glucan--maltose-1-phosphate maltosyltransferase [Psychromicrobium xiongbiense]|uniref:alpha-1,4-glucan--maltose-1-phosphate maltosyltransferase n=1 Tax=Psychromicrobium xiongbiense TaxID=3051184 RepID=UPI00255371C9|nr:alpha-1,4-glucan--maltose-1-phosphate maltosyltransferase [Psychromicrobium sp. YIM S02556]
MSQTRVGRIPITHVQPVVDGGAVPAKAVPDTDLEVGATVFREGHDLLGVQAVLLDAKGKERARITLEEQPNDRWTGRLRTRGVGKAAFRVEAYTDAYATWAHNAEVKIAAGVDVEVMLTEGARLLSRAALEKDRSAADQRTLAAAAEGLANGADQPMNRLGAGLSVEVRAAIGRLPLKELVTLSPDYPILVERDAAGRGAWYEFFPRSEGAVRDPDTGQWTSGTFRTAIASLDRVAAMEFDVIYLPPIHPIGEINRKGPNNTLVAGPADPGSPWAIGSAQGGHDAIHPDLGTFEDFAAFVARAQELGLEVALDLALQAAPDHPWAKEHQEWFTTRVDGSIAYAENPPKKYQDIYPLNFDNDPDGLSREILRIVLEWIDRGVTIFRVDNPHTKPVWFWEWLIGKVNRKHPGIVFLAEAFTRPSMMHALGRAGFQQSYSYFTWRNTKEEIEDYLQEISHGTAAFFRPNFFVNTPDILTEYLQYGGPAAFKIRAVLAAMGSPLWGVYAGYELFEHVARPGAEEYIDNEKYEYKARDFAAAEASGRSLAPYLTRLNQIRRAHPALGELSNVVIHPTSDPAVLAFSKTKVLSPKSSKGGSPVSDTVIVVVNLDPHSVREGMVYLDLSTLGLESSDFHADGTFTVNELLTGQSWQWGSQNYVRLDAHVEPAHILSIGRKA